jgi:mRNA-degrading endonuclease toxin of MazEF toxin-antitoxin module
VLIVQCDQFNQTTLDTIVAAVSTTLRGIGQANQLLIDPATKPTSGLVQPSVVRCDRLFTIDQRPVGRTIGSLSAATLRQIDGCLKAALDLP